MCIKDEKCVIHIAVYYIYITIIKNHIHEVLRIPLLAV